MFILDQMELKISLIFVFNQSMLKSKKYFHKTLGIYHFCLSYLNAIQMLCPHLLRYLTLAVIANTGKRNASEVRELVQVLQQEENSYQDPITDFLKSLCVDFDFDVAQQKLQAWKDVLSNDYFLENKQDEFLESARLFIFETYCRIHQSIDIQFVFSIFDFYF